jgi:hypothetical protein
MGRGPTPGQIASSAPKNLTPPDSNSIAHFIKKIKLKNAARQIFTITQVLEAQQLATFVSA